VMVIAAGDLGSR